MPSKHPFYYSKRALEKFEKVKEQQEKEKEEGGATPPNVNNYLTINQTTVSKSGHIDVTVERDSEAPAEINNFEVNKPQVAKSLNEYPAPTIKKRDIEELVPTVNGKVSPNLVHKPAQDTGQEFYPVIDKNPTKKRATRKKRNTKKT